ncbi:hypothetical protein [Pajaroellobacter abortibovis]|uniref:Uncharacterized protein n=1 Tax=Pajaroellobacter abortibovis TaxID=1882918 RepID=A0A1L6MW09_9BACT|nr:hypothetical protein [Pajaroellobacter abortibovis]APR99617.1 hypothetical protein BCY86_02175 [Pajaroellobacter abortibovis]
MNSRSVTLDVLVIALPKTDMTNHSTIEDPSSPPVLKEPLYPPSVLSIHSNSSSSQKHISTESDLSDP